MLGLGPGPGGRSLVKLVDPLEILAGKARLELSFERRLAAVADHPNRFDRQNAQQSLRMSGREAQRQVSTPGVPDDERSRPAETGEYGPRIIHGLTNREWAFQSRRLKTALLV